MFNKKLKQKIKDLEEKLQILKQQFYKSEETIVSVEKDFFTKNLHYKKDLVAIQGEREYQDINPYFSRNEWQKTQFYFLKGTEPKCDFIREHLDGKIDFLKNEVLCDKKGEIIRKIVK